MAWHAINRMASLCACLALLYTCLPATGSNAATTANLSAAFIPNRLSQRTTLQFGFSFSAPRGQVPPPLTEVELRYPNNLGIGLMELGLDTCTLAKLESVGPSGCLILVRRPAVDSAASVGAQLSDLGPAPVPT